MWIQKTVKFTQTYRMALWAPYAVISHIRQPSQWLHILTHKNVQKKESVAAFVCACTQTQLTSSPTKHAYRNVIQILHHLYMFCLTFWWMINLSFKINYVTVKCCFTYFLAHHQKLCLLPMYQLLIKLLVLTSWIPTSSCVYNKIQLLHVCLYYYNFNITSWSTERPWFLKFVMTNAFNWCH
jgi:hypothetical protein